MQTRELARFVSELKYEALSEATIEMAKQCILDTVGCCVRGSIEKPGIKK
jgi:2-methylcitrate dehydratase PrpD